MKCCVLFLVLLGSVGCLNAASLADNSASRKKELYGVLLELSEELSKLRHDNDENKNGDNGDLDNLPAKKPQTPGSGGKQPDEPRPSRPDAPEGKGPEKTAPEKTQPEEIASEGTGSEGAGLEETKLDGSEGKGPTGIGPQDNETGEGDGDDLEEGLRSLLEHRRETEDESKNLWEKVKNHFQCGDIDEYCGIVKLRKCCDQLECSNSWKGHCRPSI